jgi:hypothetical protein
MIALHPLKLLILFYSLAFCISVFSVEEHFFTSCRAGDAVKVKEYLDGGVTVSSRDAKGNSGSEI